MKTFRSGLSVVVGVVAVVGRMLWTMLEYLARTRVHDVMRTELRS